MYLRQKIRLYFGWVIFQLYSNQLTYWKIRSTSKMLLWTGLIFLVGECLPARISQRPALRIMKAARGLNLSPTKSRDAKLYTSSRAQSTTSVHSQVVEVFLAYLRKRNLPATTFQERVLQDFIHYLEDIRKPYSFLKQVGHVIIKQRLKYQDVCARQT